MRASLHQEEVAARALFGPQLACQHPTVAYQNREVTGWPHYPRFSRVASHFGPRKWLSCSIFSVIFRR
jgi:hypothetical protein